MTAFQAAAVEPIVPDSPMPLAPKGFTTEGVSVWSTSKGGNVDAVGMRYVVRLPDSGLAHSSYRACSHSAWP